MKKVMILLGVSILLALLTAAALLLGWWIGVALPLDISNGSRLGLALLIASLFIWGFYIASRKVLIKICMKKKDSSDKCLGDI